MPLLRVLVATMFVITLLLTLSARARPPDRRNAEAQRDVPVELPGKYLIEIRLGPYYPDVDDEFGGRATPFRELFGSDSRLAGLEYDRVLLADPQLGNLGIGVSLGYSSFSAMGLLENGKRSDQETWFSTLIGSLVLVGRASGFATLTQAPLVPYAKVGLTSGLWWIGFDDRTAEDDSGTVGRGSSCGYRYAFGMMLLLDAFDPGAAAQLHTSAGVANSYLFLEYDASYIDGFGAQALRLGARTWTGGLALEF